MLWLELGLGFGRVLVGTSVGAGAGAGVWAGDRDGTAAASCKLISHQQRASIL